LTPVIHLRCGGEVILSACALVKLCRLGQCWCAGMTSGVVHLRAGHTHSSSRETPPMSLHELRRASDGQFFVVRDFKPCRGVRVTMLSWPAMVSLGSAMATDDAEARLPLWQSHWSNADGWTQQRCWCVEFIWGRFVQDPESPRNPAMEPHQWQ
jgi:hypothetical protein